MSGWVSFGLVLLRAVLAILDHVKGAQQFKAGQDAEVAKAAVAILRKTESGKQLLEKIDAMADGDLDDLLDDLGGKS